MANRGKRGKKQQEDDWAFADEDIFIPKSRVNEQDELDRAEQERMEMELADELEMKMCLEQSIMQLDESVKEIEKRLGGIAEESNEWKTRFETQADMNKFLDRKIVEMQSKADAMRKTIRTGSLYETSSDAVYFNELNDRLETEKQQLEAQLSDLNWKLDKETKGFIKANDERKQYYLEISTITSVVEDLKTKLRAHRKATESGALGLKQAEAMTVAISPKI